MSQPVTAVETTSLTDEPPRAPSEIVSSAARVETSVAPAGERHLAEVSWNDFLAALPAALAMSADGTHATPEPASRAEPRRARGRKKRVALPRAYLAVRQGARRDRTGFTPSPATPWHEGVTGRRNSQRTALGAADRWLLAGLMLSASVLVAVLTSALTVRGMHRSGATAIATHHDTALVVASAPPVAPPARATDSVVVAATRAVDSAPAPARVAHPVRMTRREPIRPDKRSLSIAERGRVVPPALAGPAPQPVTQPVTQPITQPVTQPVSQPITQPAPGSSPAASPVTNAQFLEELRAIHAEIDARKRHMDSLMRSLDSLKKISPPS